MTTTKKATKKAAKTGNEESGAEERDTEVALQHASGTQPRTGVPSQPPGAHRQDARSVGGVREEVGPAAWQGTPRVAQGTRADHELRRLDRLGRRGQGNERRHLRSRGARRSDVLRPEGGITSDLREAAKARACRSGKRRHRESGQDDGGALPEAGIRAHHADDADAHRCAAGARGKHETHRPR